jgi:DNA polymerase-3 subunit gamma/tau
MDMARAITARDPQAVVNLLAEASRFGFDVKRFSLDLMDMWRDLVVMKAVEDSNELTDLTDEEAAELADVVDAVGWEELHARFDMLAAGVERLRIATRPGVVLEMTLLKMAKLPPLISISDMGGHLDRLAKGRTLPSRPEVFARHERVAPRAERQPEPPQAEQQQSAPPQVEPQQSAPKPVEQQQAEPPQSAPQQVQPSRVEQPPVEPPRAPAPEPAAEPVQSSAPQMPLVENRESPQVDEGPGEAAPLPPVEEYETSAPAPANTPAPAPAVDAPAPPPVEEPAVAEPVAQEPTPQTPTQQQEPAAPQSQRTLDMEGIWSALIAELGPLMSNMLSEHAKPLSWDGSVNTLTIEVEADHAFAAKRKNGEFADLVSRMVGRKATVEIVVVEGGETTVERVRRESDLARKNRTETMNHPIVRTIQDLMEAEVEDVEVLG